MLPLRSVFLLGVLLATPLAALAQPEIVPAGHPIYDYLRLQRVQGTLPEYRHEVRPMDRAHVRALLDSLSARSAALDRSARSWLRVYRQELFEPASAIETVFSPTGVELLPLGRDTEKFIYYHRDDAWRFAGELRGLPQLRLTDDGTTDTYALSMAGEVTLQGNYNDRLGFYSSFFNGIRFGGDQAAIAADPALLPLYYTQVEPDAGQFDRATASVRVASRRFSAEIAQARLLIGSGFSDGLLLTDTPDYFPFVRFGLDTRVVQYQFIHAALGDRARVFVDGEGEQIRLSGVERYLAVHRVAVQPWRWLALAFTEMIVYGNRGPELAYLNPVNPFVTAEHAEWDLDNPLFALEAIIRPVPRIEAHAMWLVDDADFSKIGENSYNNKWAFQLGVGATLRSTLAWVEYTRIDPFVYTHRFRLDGSYYNSFTHNDFSLGHPIGPNADQVEAGIDVWLPGRVRARLSTRYVRRGENLVDDEGTVVLNVGGDVRNGRQPSFREFTKIFLRGDIYKGVGGRAELAWEPIRDVLDFRLYADLQTWDRDPSTFFLRASWLVGL